MDQRSAPLTRGQIAEFVGSERGVRTFEAMQVDTGALFEVLTNTQFLVLASDPTLGAERVLTPAAGELVGTDGGANGAYTLGLADTAVVPGTYGNPAGFVTITVDRKGRATGVTTFAVTASSGVAYNNITGVFSAVPAGAYGLPTGTLTRTTFAAGISTGASAGYVQAEANAALARIAGLEERLAALITDMKANGNLT